MKQDKNTYIDLNNLFSNQSKSIFPKKRKKKIITITFFIIISIICYLITFLCINKFTSSIIDSNNYNQLKSFHINGYQLNQPFEENIYEYYVEVDKEQIELICDIEGIVSGCNETIYLENKQSHIHKLTVKRNNQNIIYTININKIEKEKIPLKIIKIEGIPLNWTNQDITIKVNTNLQEDTIEYSFDNGKTWQQNNEITIQENKKLIILLKDNEGNQSTPEEIIIDKIDKQAPIIKISKGNTTKKEITINVITEEELSGMEEITFDNKKYKNQKSFIITKPGTYKVAVTDKAGNISKTEQITITEKDFQDNDENNTKTFTATFNDNFKNEEKKISCQTNKDSCEITSPNIVKDGYQILGWSTDKNATIANIDENEKIILSKDITYYAITKKELIVTLENNGATSIGSTKEKCTIYNNEESCNIYLPTITRNGYNIIGWSNDEFATTTNLKTNDIFSINKNTTLYAITKKEVTLIFNNNGATSISSNIEKCAIYNKKNSCDITLPKITRTDYDIIGWSSDKFATNATLKQNDILPSNQNTTLYAITKKEVTATFNNNGATSISSTKEKCTIYNNEESCKIYLPTITRNDYDIIGWSNDEFATATTLKTNEQISINKNEILYAITKREITTTLNYNDNSNIAINTETCSLYNKETSCSIILPTIKRNGYTTLGWSKNKDDTTAALKENDTYTVSNNQTLYAITKKMITATFNNNGATSIDYTKESCTIYNTQKTCNVTLPTIKRSGYTIIGWGTNENDTTTTLKENDKYPLNNDQTLYAITRNDLTITLNKNGASSIEKDKIICSMYNTSAICTTTLPNITRDGYQILGWSRNQSSTSATFEMNDTITTNKNETLYAITKKALTVTLNKNGAASVGSTKETCNIFNEIKTCSVSLPAITRSGYNISGWSKNKDDTTANYKPYSRIDLIENITLYAITNKEITLTFNKNGASSIGATEKKCTIYNAQTTCNIAMPTITRNGYSVVGWSTNKNATTKNYGTYDTAAVSSNSTLYAITKKALYIYFNMNVTTQSCYMYNEQTSCSITLPSFTKPGSFNGGWDTKSNNPEPTYIAGSNLTITENKNLYGSIYNPFNYTYYKYFPINAPDYTKVRQITIQKSLTLRHTTFDYQIGIPTSAIDKHITLLNQINDEFPYLLVPGKVFIMTNSEYDYYSDYYGLTMSSGSYMFIDLKYDSQGLVVKNQIDINATLHELAHAWDHYYDFKTGNGRICNQLDFMNFYNSISDKTYVNSDGSKLSNTEMFAAMFTNYYWHILGNNTNIGYYGLKSGAKLTESEKTQIKNIIEKYAKIAKNNYK